MHRTNLPSFAVVLPFLLVLYACSACGAEPPRRAVDGAITGELRVTPGPVNGAVLRRGGKVLVVYGDPGGRLKAADTVLFTHARRDVIWAGRALVEAGAVSVAPEAEISSLRDARKFWMEFQTKRFHDYAQQTTRVPVRPLRVDRTVRGGETISAAGIAVRVLDTPGYTRGSVTYLLESEGRKVAFTGDLIYGDGKLLDLFSLQDAVDEAKIRGYHGYAGRLAQVVASLRKVAAEKPDVLVPARGPVIRDPQAALGRLLRRIQALYANYLSIDALRWYFKDEHIIAKARRVLGKDARVNWIPRAETLQETLPSWIIAIDNTRLIVSADRTGFLVDCGSRRILDKLLELRRKGTITGIEHVFVTHYHDDHTDQVSRMVETFGATVHASRRNWDILQNPSAYRMPAMTANPIHVSGRNDSGDRWRWKEFDMTLVYFPGQTLYHDALRVRKEGGKEILFAGDSFTPCGIDDYCLLNRNFLHPSTGYFFCLGFLKHEAPRALLINEHVGPLFRFSGKQIDRMIAVLERRVELLRDLLPGDDPNWGIDEGWARLYPYAVGVRRGNTAALEARIFNHSPREQIFRVTVRAPESWGRLDPAPRTIRIPPRQEGSLPLEIAVPATAGAGLAVLRADIAREGWDLREWMEALVTVSR